MSIELSFRLSRKVRLITMPDPLAEIANVALFAAASLIEPPLRAIEPMVIPLAESPDATLYVKIRRVGVLAVWS